MFLSLELLGPRAPAKTAELGVADDAAWETALAAALTPALSSAKPSEAFIAQLGRELTDTARREAQEQKVRDQWLRIAGVAGGIVSLVGGLVFWLLWRKRHKPQVTAKLGGVGGGNPSPALTPPASGA
jgi:hypothetical protein